MPKLAYFVAALFVPAFSFAVTVGQSAPDFALIGTDGKPAKLSDFKGKHVVLEWVNPGCPYVRKHYDSNNMQALQKDAAGKEVVWLAVNSTNPTHADFLKPADMASWMSKSGGAPKATLMDQDGKVGKLYSAKTTPQMYIVDPKGQLVYNGAIDDKRSANPEDVKTSKNFVKLALAETLAGKAVTTAATTPYGCSVKY